MDSFLVTGSSGFIGFHTAKELLEQGQTVIGFDNENDYYDVTLKHARRAILENFQNFTFYHGDLQNKADLENIFKNEKITYVIHLAAQAGVRYSLENPDAYIQSNIVGFHNILNLSKEYLVKNFVYASSSSVYGNNKKQPFSVSDQVDHPISLYAATKKTNELIAHTYSHLYGLPTKGLRFFTVYGPWGRPDMAMFIFAKNILNGKPIDVFNHGNMKRDFTYIDDIVKGILLATKDTTLYQVYNLGSDNPINLEEVISEIEKNLGIKAIKNYLPLQPGDVPITSADINYTTQNLGWKPQVHVMEGIKLFIDRYKRFYL